MSKNLKVSILLAGAAIGALIAHYYKPQEMDTIVLGAIVGAILVNWIIGLAD